ncbi:uncharacterized protein BDZ99DRAFT_571505 [Mytilinidion resinicola]|uniref:BTB domain-containing protein n=1 Tax=Mytilinidion resinicola TaxID=574789 RepID=A0A6A6YMD7_9PEZI|nr:uncharacterized protein BDZ99DRAFT_571505 [Mytilinidion resinicola]KAF2809743.1 hypothetical protein BDZ99DRAFT_571505 [Mytilinidion resinicola]
MASKNALRKPEDHPSFSTMGQKVATITVSPKKKAYTIRLDLLVHYSEYFRAAFTGSFKEAEEKKIHLSDVEESTFDYFMDWLYYTKITTSQEHKDPKDDPHPYYIFVELYILGDKYQIPNLRKYVIDHNFQYFLRVDDVLPVPHIITQAYESLPETSPLRRFFSDLYSIRLSSYFQAITVEMREKPSCLPNGFLVEALIKASDIRDVAKKGKSPALKLCDYHEHPDNEDRKKCEEKHGITNIKG